MTGPTIPDQLRHLADELDNDQPTKAWRAHAGELLAEVEQLRDAVSVVQEERDKARRDLRNVEAALVAQRNAQQRQAEEERARNRSHPAASLESAIEQMQDVISAQLLYVIGAGSGARRSVDIRRRQLAKYSIKHDREHGRRRFEVAAWALIEKQPWGWPWDDAQFRTLVNSDDRLLHAAALLMAAFDVDNEPVEVTGK